MMFGKNKQVEILEAAVVEAEDGRDNATKFGCLGGIAFAMFLAFAMVLGGGSSGTPQTPDTNQISIDTNCRFAKCAEVNVDIRVDGDESSVSKETNGISSEFGIDTKLDSTIDTNLQSDFSPSVDVESDFQNDMSFSPDRTITVDLGGGENTYTEWYGECQTDSGLSGGYLFGGFCISPENSQS